MAAGSGASASSSGKGYGLIVAGFLVMAVLFAVMQAIKWISPRDNRAEIPSVIINGEQLLLSRRVDGGMETEMFFIGPRRVGIPIGNNECIHTGKNANKIESVGTDGPYDQSFEEYYKSKGKKAVKVTVIYYSADSPFCSHIRKGGKNDTDGI
jgi:hypothetical protein